MRQREILGRSGATLVEMMIAMAVLSVGVIGLLATFTFLQKGIQVTKEKTLANNLAQEKIESLKNLSYHRLLVSSSTASDGNFSPSIVYDVAPNGFEIINVGGINFERRVLIRKVSENAGGNLQPQAWNAADTGLKEVLVYVIWRSGNEWRKHELRNLRDDPDREALSASFTGAVTESGTGTPLSGVTVLAMQDSSRYDETTGGSYGFSVYPGSYTLRASKDGYFVGYSGTVHAPANGATTVNFALIRKSSGSIIGSAFLRDHLVISQVVVATLTQVGNLTTQSVEYVELFNPATYPIAVGVTAGAKTVHLDYHDEDDSTLGCPGVDPGENRCDAEFGLVHVTTYVAAGHYYLIANASYFMVLGEWVSADAYYPIALSYPNYLIDGEAGAVRLSWASSGALMDAVGWADNDSSAPTAEGSQIPDPAGFDGIGTGNQIVRKSTNAATAANSPGRAHDTNNNAADFVYPEHPVFGTGLTLRPFGTTNGAHPVISGTPAAGAAVFCDDGLSSGATVDSSGTFALTNVATGYWTVLVSSGVSMRSTGTFGGLASGFTTVISTMLYLTDVSASGYVAGRVTNISGAGLSNILVEAGGGSDRTDASGNYLLLSSTGTSTLLTVNPREDNPLYVRSDAYVAVQTGGLTTANASLSQGGELFGRVTSNGVDPLPNIPVTASLNGIERGSGISGSDGRFSIASLSTGTYSVAPQLESGESASPSTATVAVTAGTNVWSATFTVSGAMGYVSGSLTTSGGAIATGVLVIATTGTITSDPPSITSATRSGSTIYYAASSFADGTYRVGVRGGSTYRVYAWYTTFSGSTPTTVRRSATGIAVAAGATVDQDFTW